MKKIALISVVALAVIVGLCAGYRLTIADGEKAIGKLAKDYNLCGLDDCDLGKDTVVSTIIGQNIGYKSRSRIAWCLGVDSWADTHVRRGGLIKAAMIEVMYWPCPRAN